MPIIAFLAPFLLSLPGYSQDLKGLSLEELMDVKVKVATHTEKPLREAPGIITVIDSDQIRKLGARNLIDVLQTVPGFSFGHDVQGNLSLITRGIWAQEGRILLLWDGHEMNDRSYGTLQLGDHFPVDHIERVEIIRGPGSVIYGGIAELGVINVVTKSAEKLNGVAASAWHSRTSSGPSDSIASVMLGQKQGDLSFSLKGMFRESNFTDQNYTDENGVTENLGGGNATMANEHLSLRVGWKNFYFGYLKDDYRTRNIILWGDLENTSGSGVIRPPVPKEHPTVSHVFGWEGEVTQNLKLHSYLQNKTQHPYFQPDASRETDYANSWRRRVDRRLLGSILQYQATPVSHILLGGEYSEDKSQILNRETYSGGNDTFGNGSRTYKLTNAAVFAQYELSTSFANFTAGVRYDNPSVTRDVFVPRLGMTKIFGKQHIKLLYAEAFRAPLIENVSLNDQIDPEITRTLELEYGILLSPKFSFTTNVFSTSVRDIIVYSYDSGSATENYTNYDEVKTWGIESEIRRTGDRHDLRANYSYYATDVLDADPFRSRLSDQGLLGAPRHKFFLSDAVTLGEGLTFTPSVIYYVDTTGFERTAGSFKERRLPNQLIGNLWLQKENILIDGVSAGAGVQNILNSRVYYPQPYVKEGDFKAGPYPGRSRDYVVKLEYKKEF